jgi:polyisoprenoid-binding protein YceI
MANDLQALTPGIWNVDASHSTIGFTARHLMVTKVRGRFSTFSGALTIAANPLESSLEASVDIASVSTGDAGRDGHLTSPDFFDAAQFPTMTLKSTSIVADGDDYLLNGDLTIKGVTKPVTFELEFDGVATDPWGNTKAGFSAEAEINRKDWGLEWNVALETGGVLVSEKIKIELDIQAVKA